MNIVYLNGLFSFTYTVFWDGALSLHMFPFVNISW